MSSTSVTMQLGHVCLQSSSVSRQQIAQGLAVGLQQELAFVWQYDVFVEVLLSAICFRDTWSGLTDSLCIFELRLSTCMLQDVRQGYADFLGVLCCSVGCGIQV